MGLPVACCKCNVYSQYRHNPDYDEVMELVSLLDNIEKDFE